MTYPSVATWEMGLQAVIDEVLLGDAIHVDRGTRRRIGDAVLASVRAMPHLQRRALQIVVATRPPSRRHRPRGAWILTTRVPGAADVGNALHSLISFHAWSEIADPELPGA